MTLVDSAVYVDGKRAEEPRTLVEAHEAARERGGVVWIGLFRGDSRLRRGGLRGDGPPW
jgi:magnesium transporter